MDLVLDDLEAMVQGGQIGQVTYRRPREMILGSPHFASDNGWPPPRAHRRQTRPMFLSYQRMPMMLRPGVDRMIVLPLVYATPPPAPDDESGLACAEGRL